MDSRTQIVCLHEGKKGKSIDPIFIRVLLKKLNPAWINPWQGNNVILAKDYGGRTSLIAAVPGELKRCLSFGGHTTLLVWADVDDDMAGCEELKNAFWKVAQQEGVSRADFDQVVFVFAKDRLENWIEFLRTGATDETKEGPRLKHDREVADAARSLADRCLRGAPIPNIPPSLEWSCSNWRALVNRMR